MAWPSGRILLVHRALVEWSAASPRRTKPHTHFKHTIERLGHTGDYRRRLRGGRLRAGRRDMACAITAGQETPSRRKRRILGQRWPQGLNGAHAVAPAVR